MFKLKRPIYKSIAFQYSAAILATVSAVSIRWLLHPFLGQYLALVTLYGAIAFSSWLGGYKPAILSAIIGYALCSYFIIEPKFAFNSNFNQLVGILAYSFTCLIIISMGEITRNAERGLRKKEIERQQIEAELLESEQTVRTILESITDGFYALDADWRFRYVNPAAQRALGREAGDLIGKNKWEEFPETLGGDIEFAYRKVMKDKVSSNITTFYAPHDKWYEIRIYPAGDGLSIYFRDVTTRIQAEKQLKLQSNELAENDRRKDEFLATLAHELRNPLAPIRNSLSILELKGIDVTSVAKTTAVINRQVDQMVRLVDDLMDISRINHGKFELRKEQIELAWVIKSAIEATRPTIEAAGLKLIVDIPTQPIVLNADLTRLAQVFINLLNNAAKFTDANGVVKLIVELRDDADVESNNKMVSIKITDTGIGISAEHIPKIFEAFTQIPNSLKRTHGGLGVGLALVKKFVEFHDGTISVQSDGLGLGTTFNVELPVMSKFVTSVKYDVSHEDLNQFTNNLRILIVDDNRDAATSLAILLEMTGNETHVVYDGTSALEVIESYQPHVVLLDIGMPGIDGHEVARYIRKQEWGKKIQIIAVTGWGEVNDKRNTKESGFNAHFVKPVDTKELLSWISTIKPGG